MTAVPRPVMLKTSTIDKTKSSLDGSRLMAPIIAPGRSTRFNSPS
jgi:hypothetical protein